MSMKTLLAFVTVGALIAAPALAQAAPTAYTRASHEGWSSRVHVYAPNHYAPWYHSNANMNQTLARF
jgi:hypothetical protein